MKRTRRTFSREYKLAAVKKVIEHGLSYREVARYLGIRDTLIHNWRKVFEVDGTFQAEVRHSLERQFIEFVCFIFFFSSEDGRGNNLCRPKRI